MDSSQASAVVAAAVAIAAIPLLLGLHRLIWRGLQDVSHWHRLLFGRLVDSRGYAKGRKTLRPLAARYPSVFRVVGARFEMSRFAGLPLTLLTVAAAYIAVLFGGLIKELYEAEKVIWVDNFVNAALEPARVQPVLAAFLWITTLASSPSILTAAIAASGFLWLGAARGRILGLWTALVGTQLTTWSGKLIIGRARPEPLDLVTGFGAAFPSGHATASVAVYGFLAYVMMRGTTDPRRRFDIIYWTLVLLLLIGLSRIVLRVHYLSDVLGGWLVGGFWLLAGVMAAEWERLGKVRGRSP